MGAAGGSRKRLAYPKVHAMGPRLEMAYSSFFRRVGARGQSDAKLDLTPELGTKWPKARCDAYVLVACPVATRESARSAGPARFRPARAGRVPRFAAGVSRSAVAVEPGRAHAADLRPVLAAADARGLRLVAGVCVRRRLFRRNVRDRQTLHPP